MEDGTSVLLGTPMVYRLLAPVLRGTRRRVGVRVALSAGGPMGSEAAAAAAAGLGTPVRKIYGITEVGLVACVPVGLESWPEGSVGRAAPGVTLRVGPVAVEDGPAVAGGGHTGRLLVRTPAMFNGYVGGSGAHLTAEGYYDTGDLVRLDEDGFLHVVGRKANFINVGGRKVNPRRIERILC